jgi:hypothetical protein
MELRDLETSPLRPRGTFVVGRNGIPSHGEIWARPRITQGRLADATGWWSMWRPFVRARRVTEKTQLLRQVHPNFIQNGEVGVLASRLNQKDQGAPGVCSRTQLAFTGRDLTSPLPACLHTDPRRRFDSDRRGRAE